MLSQGELATGAAQAIDDLDRHDIGWPNRLLPLGHMAIHDLVEMEEFPEPQTQVDVAEPACIGPTDRTQADPHHVGIIRDWDLVILGEEAELLVVPLAIVDADGALPASLLVVVEFAEISDDVLPRSGFGAYALDEGVVSMSLAVFSPGVASQEHAGPPGDEHDR